MEIGKSKTNENRLKNNGNVIRVPFTLECIKGKKSFGATGNRRRRRRKKKTHEKFLATYALLFRKSNRCDLGLLSNRMWETETETPLFYIDGFVRVSGLTNKKRKKKSYHKQLMCAVCTRVQC